MRSARKEAALVGLTYEPGFLAPERASELLKHCLTVLPWREELVQMFGRTFTAPRLSCAIADIGCTYRYRGSQTNPIRFTPELDTLRCQLREQLHVRFNYVLATHYRDGNDYVGWHADDERDLVPRQTIANISLGSTREFRIKNRDGSYVRRLPTEHGSLTLMQGDMHRTTKHTLVRTTRLVTSRVVLSFRQVQQ